MRIQTSAVNKNVSCKQAKRQTILLTNFEGLVRTVNYLSRLFILSLAYRFHPFVCTFHGKFFYSQMCRKFMSLKLGILAEVRPSIVSKKWSLPNSLIMQFSFTIQTFHKSYQSWNLIQTLTRGLQSRNIRV